MWNSHNTARPPARLRDDKHCRRNKHVDAGVMPSQDAGSIPATSTNAHSLLAEVLTLASSFFVPFVVVSQGFTEISAANRESLNWTSGSVF